MSPENLNTKFRSEIRAVCAVGGRWPLYLWSHNPGTGKTTAATMLLDRAYAPSEFDYAPSDAMDVMYGLIDYRLFPAFLDGCRRGECSWSNYSAGGKLDEGKVWSFIDRAPLVVVDDVCDLPTEAAKFGHDHRGLLKKILDVRGQRPTVVTGNLSPWAATVGGKAELTRVLDTAGIDRLTDRLTCGTIIEMAGESLRWK